MTSVRQFGSPGRWSLPSRRMLTVRSSGGRASRVGAGVGLGVGDGEGDGVGGKLAARAGASLFAQPATSNSHPIKTNSAMGCHGRRGTGASLGIRIGPSFIWGMKTAGNEPPIEGCAGCKVQLRLRPKFGQVWVAVRLIAQRLVDQF